LFRFDAPSAGSRRRGLTCRATSGNPHLSSYIPFGSCDFWARWVPERLMSYQSMPSMLFVSFFLSGTVSLGIVWSEAGRSRASTVRLLTVGFCFVIPAAGGSPVESNFFWHRSLELISHDHVLACSRTRGSLKLYCTPGQFDHQGCVVMDFRNSQSRLRCQQLRHILHTQDKVRKQKRKEDWELRLGRLRVTRLAFI